MAAGAFAAAVLGADAVASWLLAGGIALITGGMFALTSQGTGVARAMAVLVAALCLMAFTVALRASRDAGGRVPAATWWTAVLLLAVPGVVLPIAWRRRVDRS